MILTGHRDTHFRFLEKVQAGRPHDPHEDMTPLILVTCYLFDPIVPGGPLRYMVTAEIVERMAED